MDHYTEIQVLADPEFKETTLMNAVFSKLHRALVKHKNLEIGLSFPNFGNTLGEKLRLHGSFSDLKCLMGESWLRGLKDHTVVTAINACPETKGFILTRRIQTKSSAERLQRRSIVKGWLTPAEAKERIAKTSSKKLRLPYVEITSSSTGQRFRLFIEQVPVTKPSPGKFSRYGLSLGATIPWF